MIYCIIIFFCIYLFFKMQYFNKLWWIFACIYLHGHIPSAQHIFSLHIYYFAILFSPLWFYLLHFAVTFATLCISRKSPKSDDESPTPPKPSKPSRPKHETPDNGMYLPLQTCIIMVKFMYRDLYIMIYQNVLFWHKNIIKS